MKYICTLAEKCGIWSKSKSQKQCEFHNSTMSWISACRNSRCPFPPQYILTEEKPEGAPTKKDRMSVSIADCGDREAFRKEFLKYHCPTPDIPTDAPYRACKQCFYCEWMPYRTCRIYVMMRDGKIYG